MILKTPYTRHRTYEPMQRPLPKQRIVVYRERRVPMKFGSKTLPQTADRSYGLVSSANYSGPNATMRIDVDNSDATSCQRQRTPNPTIRIDINDTQCLDEVIKQASPSRGSELETASTPNRYRYVA